MLLNLRKIHCTFAALVIRADDYLTYHVGVVDYLNSFFTAPYTILKLLKIKKAISVTINSLTKYWKVPMKCAIKYNTGDTVVPRADPIYAVYERIPLGSPMIYKTKSKSRSNILYISERRIFATHRLFRSPRYFLVFILLHCLQHPCAVQAALSVGLFFRLCRA